MFGVSLPRPFTLTTAPARGVVVPRAALLTKAAWLSGSGAGLPIAVRVTGDAGQVRPYAPPTPTGQIHGLGPLLDGVGALPLVPVIFQRDDGRP